MPCLKAAVIMPDLMGYGTRSEVVGLSGLEYPLNPNWVGVGHSLAATSSSLASISSMRRHSERSEGISAFAGGGSFFAGALRSDRRARPDISTENDTPRAWALVLSTGAPTRGLPQKRLR